MGLLDQYKIGGPSLFDSVDTPFGGRPAEQKRGGVFGSGYNGEDIMSMLLRAAAIAQGDLGAGAQFGANIGAKARAEAEAAAKRQAEWEDWLRREDYTREHQAPDVPPMVRDTEAYRAMDPDQRRAWTEMQSVLNPPAGDKYVISDGQLVRVPGAAPPQAGGNTKVVGGKTYRNVNGEWYEEGDGASNGPGGFRR